MFYTFSARKFSSRGNAEECDLGTPPPQSAWDRRAVPEERPKLPKVTGVSGASWTASAVRLSAHEEEADQDMNGSGLVVLLGLLWRCCGAQQRGEWTRACVCVCVCV